MMTRDRSGCTPWLAIIDRDGIVGYNDFHVNVDQADMLIRDALKNSSAKR